jgi:hypothetical protein
MGGGDPFAGLFGGMGGMGGGGPFGGGMHGMPPGMQGMGGGGGPFGGPMGGHSGPVKDKPITKHLACTLEELFTGSTRKLKITRTIFNGAGKAGRSEEEILEVNVKPGWKKGTKVTFPEKGEQRYSCTTCGCQSNMFFNCAGGMGKRVAGGEADKMCAGGLGRVSGRCCCNVRPYCYIILHAPCSSVQRSAGHAAQIAGGVATDRRHGKHVHAARSVRLCLRVTLHLLLCCCRRRAARAHCSRHGLHYR